MKRNYIWAAFDKLSQLFIGLLITKLLASYFGADLFGAYQFALSTFAVATSMTWLCPAELFYGRIDERGRLDNTVITTSIIYRFALCSLICVAGYSYTYLFIPDPTKIAFTSILLLSLIYSEPLGIFRLLLETTGGYHLTSKVRFLGVATKVFVVGLIVILKLPPIIAVASALMESLVVSLVCLILYRTRVSPYEFFISDFRSDFLKEASVEGFKFWPGLVSMTFALKADRILLGGALDRHLFGAYAAGMSLFEQFTTIGTSIIAVAAPIYIYRATGDKLKFNFVTSIGAMVAISVLGTATLYALAPSLVRVVYGEKFLYAVDVFRAVLPFSPIVFVELITSTLMIKNKVPWIFSFKWVVATVVCLITLSVSPDPKSGVYAHVLSWVVAATISGGYAFKYFKSSKLNEVRIVA